MRQALSSSALLLVCCTALLGPGPGACAGVSVLSPAAGRVLLGPEVEVSLLFHPRVAPRERVRVELEAGLDAPEGPARRDLSDRLVVGADGRLATLWIDDLPPGRSRLRVERGLPWAPDPPSGPPRASVEHVLDRGGFFPEARGPFAAGVRGAEVPRVLGDGSIRTLEVLVWFPTDDTEPPHPGLHALPRAPLAADAAGLPAVVFSHGNCGLPENYAILLSTLARAGWLAAAMTHPGNTARDPGCGSIPAQIESFVQRPGDVVATLDWLLDESAAPASPLAGAVDPERVALAVHSFGALATVRTAAMEPRARAALPLAPVYAAVAPLLAPGLPLPVPVMLQVGENDATTPPETDARPLYEALAPPRFLVELLGAGHPVFEDSCATPLPGVCPEDGHARVARFALGFLGRYVAGDLRWEALLAPAPGVSWSADP